MKRNITLLVLAFFVMGFRFMANAQVIDVYAGNDTVELKVGNYQYGFIQWQYSHDNVSYADIEGATEEAYRCLPDRNTYYRAMVTFSNCQPIFSRVCHVQLRPKANGGPSRVLAEGDGAMLYARLEEDCIGEWKIIEGTGGSLDDPSSPTCYFIGTDAEYKLTWTVTNAAGSDTDTISIKYIHTIYNENFAVVDTTDVILSDSVQMASGLYIVQFSDPIPHIEDSTLMIGVGEQGFIRKVTGFEANGNVYTIHTTDASIYDLVIEGALSIDYSDYDVSKGRHQIVHRYPTRKDLMKEEVKSGKYIFMPKAIEDKLKASMKQKDGETPYVSLDVGIINLSDFQLELIPRHDFKPNFVHNFVKDRWWHISSFQFGLYNAEYIKQSEIRIGSCNVQIPFLASGPKGPFFSTPLPPIIVAGAPLVIDLDVYYEYSLEGFMSFSPSYRYYQRDVSYYTRAIEYEDGIWRTVSDESEEHYREVEGHEHGKIGLDVFAGVRMTFMLYKIIGPYLSVGPYWNLTFNTIPNFAAASEAGVRILVGVQSRKFLGYQFDFAASLNCPATRFEFPNKLYYISGNRQQFDLGNFLAEPLKVKVTSSRTDAPFLRTKVKFETDNGYLSESEVRTDGEGCAETRWKPTHTETGTVTARAYVCDVDGRVVDGAPIYFTAYENNFGDNDCTNTTLSVRAEKRNGFLMPVASAGDPPYSYSDDGVIFEPVSPQVIPVAGVTYIFYVRDNHGCVEQCSYTEPVFNCYNNHPLLSVNQTGNTLIAEATGGTPPYEYSIDGINYSDSGTFADLENGEYIVSVRDSKSCTDVYYYELFVVDEDSDGLPTVTTCPVDETCITSNSAILKGRVELARVGRSNTLGFCYSTVPNTDSDSPDAVVLNAGNGLGEFSGMATGLAPNTTYYFKAFVVTEAGEAFHGEEFSFTTLSIGSGNVPTGAICGKFKINEKGEKVHFSKGNLQYNAALGTHAVENGVTAQGTWRFAEKQWDYIGEGNNNISQTYNGWIDYYGWGTSGWNSGANCYQPWSTSYTNGDYYPGGNPEADLAGDYANADWGVYNAISNGGNQPGLWHTLSYDEWSYMMFNRNTSSGIRFVKAQVNGINGTIIFPDDWHSSIYTLNGINERGADYSVNVIDAATWENTLESNGSVFIPACGYRNSANIWNVGEHGRYWTSTARDSDGAYQFDLYPTYIEFGDLNPPYALLYRFYGCSVRLVCPAQGVSLVNVSANPANYGQVVGGGAFPIGAVCTLTATANEGYVFRGWTENGHIVSEEASYSFMVTNDRSLMALFVLSPSGVYDDVDLGLPSGTLWATCNVGANAPEEYGDYFAWGEIQPKDIYDWNTYQYCMGEERQLTKYCYDTSYGYNGFCDNITELQPEDDAATANWGGAWRTPSNEDWQELLDNTTYVWSTQNGVNGFLFMSGNGNSLFIPATGLYNEDVIYGSGDETFYWANNLYTGSWNDAPIWASFLNSSYNNEELINHTGTTRYYGLPVRPVRSAKAKN